MAQKRKPLMRSLGEFVGYIVKAAKSDPAPKRIMVNKTVDQEDRDKVTLRRTTIDEIEFKRDQPDEE